MYERTRHSLTLNIKTSGCVTCNKLYWNWRTVPHIQRCWHHTSSAADTTHPMLLTPYTAFWVWPHFTSTPH